VRLEHGGGFDITEAGTKKSVAAALVLDPQLVPGVARLGPDALELDRDGLAAALASRPGRIKTVITDQTVLAGIGNAYSDEILHMAKLSPFATARSLGPDELDRLALAMSEVLDGAVARSVGAEAARLKGEKRTGLRVHAGPVCPARSAVTPSPRCPSRTVPFNTVRRAKRVGDCWLIADGRVW